MGERKPGDRWFTVEGARGGRWSLVPWLWMSHRDRETRGESVDIEDTGGFAGLDAFVAKLNERWGCTGEGESTVHVCLDSPMDGGGWTAEVWSGLSNSWLETIPYTGDTTEIDRRVAGYLAWIGETP